MREETDLWISSAASVFVGMTNAYDFEGQCEQVGQEGTTPTTVENLYSDFVSLRRGHLNVLHPEMITCSPTHCGLACYGLASEVRHERADHLSISIVPGLGRDMEIR